MAELRIRFLPHLKLRLGEWLSSVILASMGVTLTIWPGIVQAKIYPIMREYGNGYPAVFWSLVFGIVGGTRLIALYVNGRKTITPYIRMTMAFLSCFVWWQVTINFFLSGVPALIWGVFPWLLALEIYNVFQSSADARDVFDHKRASRNGIGQA